MSVRQIRLYGDPVLRTVGAFLLRAVLNPPWSLRIHEESPLAVLAMARGSMWIIPDGGSAQRLAAGADAEPHRVGLTSA